MSDDIEEYLARHTEFLRDVAGRLLVLISDYMTNVARVDRVSARAKDPDRFASKSATIGEDGKLKYTDPLVQIQDQIGARIVVFYRQDVITVSEKIRRYFEPIEFREVVPDSEWKFGYFGMHFILPLPKDVFPTGIDESRIPRFFELQIKTLFQHAWSEANHDLGYKTTRELTSDQQRRMAFTAAQAWGADDMFSGLFNELGAGDKINSVTG